MKKLIGLITSDLSDPYQAAIWKGVESGAEQAGLGLVTFVGAIPGSPVPSEATSNIAYRIATANSVDGLIAVASTLTSYQSTDAVRALMNSKRGLPWISVGAKVGVEPSVVVDGRSALHNLVVHLVHDHGRRRIALITGPEIHPEVRERYEVVANALGQDSLEVDPELVVAGDFTPPSGIAAVSTLIERNSRFDALICMNDRMAISAIEALRKAGRRVPEDVSVIGFDGIPEGESLDFPLTTVVQPLYQLGKEAVDIMQRVLHSETVSDRKLSCSVVVKETCGCPPIPFDGWLHRQGRNISQWAGMEEAHHLLQLADADDFDAFGRVLNSTITQNAAKNADPELWGGLLHYIRSECRSSSTGEIYEFGKTIVGKACSQLQTARRIAAEQSSLEMQRISASLAGSFRLDKMLDSLHTGLEKLRIGQGYLALYSSGRRSKQAATLAMSPGDPMPGAPHSHTFPSSQIVPHSAGSSWKRLRWVYLPLVFENEALGYMLLPGGIAEPSIYASLKDQVSSSLKGALLLDQVRTHEEKLERQVALRTKEIRQKNSDLKAEIKRRAALEQEVVEVSSRTIERIGQDLHDDLSQHLARTAMLASLTEETLEKAHRPEAVALARIAALLRDSVLKIKHIARGLIATGLEAQGLSSAIESLIDSIRKNYNTIIEFQSVPEFSLDDPDRALQVYRIVQEALLNAVRHSAAKRITVRLGVEPAAGSSQGSLQILSAEVGDHGLGNPREFVASGLGLRIMRYRAHMAGAVLSLVPNNPGTRVVCKFSKER